MSLINCPECGRDVSDMANVCIHCGFPLKKEDATTKTDTINSLKKVVIQSNTSNKLVAIRVVRQVTGLGLAGAKALVESTNPVVVNNVDLNRANAVANQFIREGISAQVVNADETLTSIEIKGGTSDGHINAEKTSYTMNVPQKNKSIGRGIKKGLTISALVFVGIFIIIIALALLLPENTQTNDKVINLLMKECEISQAEAEQIKKDLQDVGIEDLTKLTEFEGAQVESMKSFKYSSSTVSGTLILENNKTNYIGSGDIVLFDVDKGGAIDNVSRYYITEDEKNNFIYSTEEYIKQCLRSPSTAEFPNWYSENWRVTRKDNIVTVSSYVDAQNAFGAVVRNNFIVQYDYSTKLSTYCEIDDQIIYDSSK